MERKNTILLTVIAVATLLVAVVGATFAYFTATITDNRTDSDADAGKANITSGQVAGTTIVGNVEGAAGKFTATDAYPGHKEVAALQVTARGTAGSKTVVDFIYDVTANDLGANNVKVRLYRTTTKVATTANYFNCTHKVETVDSENRYSETCAVDETALGTQIKETTLTGGAQSNLVIGQDTITTTAADTDEIVYYYVVVEFVNDTTAGQNDYMGKTLTGTVSVKPAA